MISIQVFNFFVSLITIPVAMVIRKQASNPHDYFDKTFEEYKRGFSANGEF